MIKVFYLILSDGLDNKNYSWNFFQSEILHKILKKEINQILLKELNKELIDQCMPFSINYTEIKQMIIKVNKNIVNILDFIKITVDYNVKKNIVNSLFQSNLNKHNKLSSIKSQIENKENLISFSSEYLSVMQRELTLMLAHKNSSQIQQNLIFKYDLIEKYKISINSETLRGNFKPRVTFKLKGKYKSSESFVNTILAVKDRNIFSIIDSHYNNDKINSNIINQSDVNSSNLNFNIEEKSKEKFSENKYDKILNKNNQILHKTSIHKLEIPKQKSINIENTSSKSRNINQNIYYSNNTNQVNIDKNRSNQNISRTNIPQKAYFTTARTGDKTNSKTIGSTICRDVESLENIIKDDKLCDVIPINHAIKPIPKPLNEEQSRNYKISSFSLDEHRVNDNSHKNISETKRKVQPTLKTIEEEFNNNINNTISRKRRIDEDYNIIDNEFYLNDDDFLNKIELNPDKQFLSGEENDQNHYVKSSPNFLENNNYKLSDNFIPSTSSIEENIKNINISCKEHKKMRSLFDNLENYQGNSKKPTKKGNSLKFDTKKCSSNYMCC